VTVLIDEGGVEKVGGDRALHLVADWGRGGPEGLAAVPESPSPRAAPARSEPWGHSLRRNPIACTIDVICN
jgi:hypothetical protein